jgi:hypothetical protein
VKAGVPQGTVIGPSCFVYCINDLQPTCSATKFVDDTTIWEACLSDDDSEIQTAANQAAEWAEKNCMELNTKKTKEVTISYSRKPVSLTPIHINNQAVECVETFKLLGILFNNRLTWHDHVEYICSKAARRLYFLTLLKRSGCSTSDITSVYCSTIRSVLEYAVELWHPGLTKELATKIEHIQKRAMRIILPDQSYADALQTLSMEHLYTRRSSRCESLFRDIQDPQHRLNYLLPPLRLETRTRSNMKFQLPKVKTERCKKSPINYLIYNCNRCLNLFFYTYLYLPVLQYIFYILSII